MLGIGAHTFYNYVFSEPTKAINIAAEFIVNLMNLNIYLLKILKGGAIKL